MERKFVRRNFNYKKGNSPSIKKDGFQTKAMKDSELCLWFYFFCLRSSFQVLLIPFFHLTAHRVVLRASMLK